MAVAVVQSGGGSTASLTELLVGLSNSLSRGPPLGCGRSSFAHSHFPVLHQQDHPYHPYHPYHQQQQEDEPNDPMRARRKRRRDVLDVFFDARGGFSAPPSPAAVRAHTRHLLQCARQNISSVSETHAAVLDLLCGAVVPSEPSELTEAELMLHVILRTSVAAAPTWQRQPVAPRCWLSARATALVERSRALQQRMRWSCDPDPIVHAVLGAGGAAYGGGDFADLAGTSAASTAVAKGTAAAAVVVGSCAMSFALSRWDIAAECEEARRLFARGAKDRSCTEERTRSRAATQEEEVEVEVEEEEEEEKRKEKKEERKRKEDEEERGYVPATLFRSVYPPSEAHCSLLFVALHCSVVGARDPFHFLHVDNGAAEDCADGLHYPRDPTGAGAAPLVRLSSEFISSRGRDALCARGVLSLLRWGTAHGTLFLRLQRLCAHALLPAWRGVLGQYGRCALDALRRILTLLQRIVAQSQARRGGPHGVSFAELISAQSALRRVAKDTVALADAFGVTARRDWDASAALARLSSATLLSALHAQFARRATNTSANTNANTRNTKNTNVEDRVDVIGALLLAVLRPLHRMLDAWLSRGVLDDPFDEFFIVPSHGATPSGFCVDAAAQRLPDFVSRDAADAVLHAGVSLRALRGAARGAAECADRDARRAAFVSEDVDGYAHNSGGVAEQLRGFVLALLGRTQIETQIKEEAQRAEEGQVPVVDLCARAGGIAYRRAFYAACGALLLDDGPAVVVEGSPVVGEGVVGSPVGSLCAPAASAQSGLLSRSHSGAAEERSLVTWVSRQSRAASAWHDAVVSEALRDDAVAMARAAVVKRREELRAVYVRRVRRHDAQRRLQQWKAQRFALCAARATALSSAADDLLELCDAAAATGEPLVRPLRDSEDNINNGMVSHSCPLGNNSNSGGNNNNNNNNNSSGGGGGLVIPSFFAVTSRRASRSGPIVTTPRATITALQPTATAFSHPSEMYVVADINDDEYIAQRTGPSVKDTSAQDAILAALDEEAARVRDVDIASEAYQQQCASIATRTLRSRSRLTAAASNTEDTAGNSPNDSDDSGAVITNVWWTDPTVADGPTLFAVAGGGDAAEAYKALALSEADAHSVLHCASYYIALGRQAASYLTHKALQVMLLGPYGTLFRLTQQLTGVCLMQSGRAAERIAGLWQRLAMAAMEENQFNASAIFAALNAAFVEEWESCVLYGRETLRVQLALLPAQSDGSGGDDEEGDMNMESTRGANDSSSRGGVPPLDTAFHSRRHKEEDEERTSESEGKGGSATGALGPLPENPFDFTSRLTILHDEPCDEFWVLPSHAMTAYGDIFSTLLFWTSVTQLVTRVWRVGMKSGLVEAFIFCSVARSVLHAVSQHMWYLIAGHVEAYHRSLRFDVGVLYSYRDLGRFTADHADFLAECRFAAMLEPCFARARRQVYGIVRQVEEVEQCLMRYTAEAAAAAAAAVTAVSVSVSVVQSPQSASPARKAPVSPPPPSRRASRPKSVPAAQQAQHTPRRRGSKTQQTQETQQTQQTLRRQTRDTLKRRLRSLAGLTEIFVGHLAAVRDDVDSDAVDARDAAGDEEREEVATRRDSARNAARVEALASLIRTLEMTQVAVKDKL